jgi:hypothetical protein
VIDVDAISTTTSGAMVLDHPAALHRMPSVQEDFKVLTRQDYEQPDTETRIRRRHMGIEN